MRHSDNVELKKSSKQKSSVYVIDGANTEAIKALLESANEEQLGLDLNGAYPSSAGVKWWKE